MKPEDFGYKTKNGVMGFQKGPLSQWYGGFSGQSSDFHYNGNMYNCCEQFMMAQKAQLFEDQQSYCRILKLKSPAAQKKQGRRVANFSQKVWDQKKMSIVVYGNLLKFTQNSELAKFLISTGDLVLVEAAPWDNVWGSGTDLDDERTYNKELWVGENLLGQALMEVRQFLFNNGEEI
jgi:ribA/ribD-fused uncharacterized protein